jgi:hypothetical protein
MCVCVLKLFESSALTSETIPQMLDEEGPLPLPWTTAIAQLLIGVLAVALLMLVGIVRKPLGIFSAGEWKLIANIAVYNAIGHVWVVS